MLIRLGYIIKPLHLGKADKLTFEVAYDGLEVTIDFEKIPPEKMLKDYDAKDIIVTATTQLKLSDKREKQFAEIKSPLSNSIHDFIRPIHLSLYDCILKSIKGLRWRLRNESYSNPVKFWVGYGYSPDGITWKSFPDQITSSFTFGFPVKQEYTSDELISVQELTSKGEIEPLGHELLHEAWELRKNNPRSSLVIGLAAAETGFKQFSSGLIPEASWLIQNVPSPPLVKMLENFLPQISTKNKIYGKTLPPPKDFLHILTKGVNIRNEIVHGKKTELKKDTVEEVLNTVRDLLYLLDYYNGHTWAWSHITVTTLNALVEAAKKSN